jgi:hypothetical protein
MQARAEREKTQQKIPPEDGISLRKSAISPRPATCGEATEKPGPQQGGGGTDLTNS